MLAANAKSLTRQLRTVKRKQTLNVPFAIPATLYRIIFAEFAIKFSQTAIPAANSAIIAKFATQGITTATVARCATSNTAASIA